MTQAAASRDSTRGRRVPVEGVTLSLHVTPAQAHRGYKHINGKPSTTGIYLPYDIIPPTNCLAFSVSRPACALCCHPLSQREKREACLCVGTALCCWLTFSETRVATHRQGGSAQTPRNLSIGAVPCTYACGCRCLPWLRLTRAMRCEDQMSCHRSWRSVRPVNPVTNASAWGNEPIRAYGRRLTNTAPIYPCFVPLCKSLGLHTRVQRPDDDESLMQRHELAPKARR